MKEQTFEAPDLSPMSNREVCQLMLACGMSDDPSDKAFVKACRDELAKRKPVDTSNVVLLKRDQP